MFHVFEYVVRVFLQYDAEWRHLKQSKSVAVSQAILDLEINYATHEQDFYLYRIPEEDNEHFEGIFSLFDTMDQVWTFFTRGLDKKQRFIIEEYYKEGRTFDLIGAQLRVTRQRVQQIKAAALGKIREKLQLVKAFSDLFEKRMDE